MTTVGVDEGHWYRCGLIRRHDFQQQALVSVGVSAPGWERVSDNVGGAVAALQGSRELTGQKLPVEVSGVGPLRCPKQPSCKWLTR